MTVTMYRLFTLTLYISASVAAPQNPQDDSNITYIHLTPNIYDEPDSKTTSREFKTENIPLIKENNNKNGHIENYKQEENKSISNYPDKIISFNGTTEDNIYIKDNVTNVGTTIEDINRTKKTIQEDQKLLEEHRVHELTGKDLPVTDHGDRKEPITDFTALESQQTNTIATNSSESNNQTKEDFTSDDKDSNITTFNSEENIIHREVATVGETTVISIVEGITKAPLRKYKPKLSHFGKAIKKSHSKNLISESGKRKFISKCKCEKIWNCSKLQISVPRCPEEYFMCCS